MSISGINHITLRTRNLDESEVFYTKVLGLKRVGQREHMRFYSSGGYAHELALLLDPKYQRSSNDGLMHVCFNVESEAGFQSLFNQCEAQGLTSSGVNHVIMHSFYLRDPDGHVVEIGIDRPSHEWENKPNPFAEDYFLDIK